MRLLLLLLLLTDFCRPTGAASNDTVLLTPRAQAAGAAWGNIFIVAGGVNSRGAVQKGVDMVSVNLASGAMTPLSAPDLITPRQKLAAGAAGGVILFAGGSEYVLATLSVFTFAQQEPGTIKRGHHLSHGE